MQNIRFAFDVGTASIGWAVLEMGELGARDVLALGVRVFDEPVDPKTRESNAVRRRVARSQRRRARRRTTRQRILLRELVRGGFLTEEQSQKAPYGFSGKPYALRAKALDHLLSPHEFAEVVYHIGKRRGFRSNRKDAQKALDPEAKKDSEALAGFEAEFTASGKRSIGEYFAATITASPLTRVRGQRTLRKMYEDELNLIIGKQIEFGLQGLTQNFAARLKEVIFFQRSYRLPASRANGRIGICELENVPGAEERRTHRWDPLFQEFRIEKLLNDLRVIDQTTSRDRALGDEERIIVLDLLEHHEKVTFTKIRKKLGLRDSERFNFEDRNTDRLTGNQVLPKLERTLLEHGAWESLDTNDRYRLLQELSECETEDNVTLWIKENRNHLKSAARDSELVTAAMKLALPEGMTSYSRKALAKLMPHLRQGLSEYKAREAAYPKRSAANTVMLLDLPPDYRNPTVNRAMCQFRRVINALIKTHGKPTSIAIEYAREFGKSQRQRSEIQSEQKRREKQRESDKAELIAEGGRGTQEELIKLKLWRQQKEVCPYTGKTITKTDLFREGVIEVDHIRPFSRSLDDSLNNLVVCLAEANQDKGNQTPGEWLSQSPKQYQAMLERVARFDMPHSKKKRFYSDDQAEPDSFIERQLNDTRYIARAIHEYVQPLFEPSVRKRAISICRGGLTGWLRHLWGLPTKDRSLHLHHAIDAVVIGCVTPSMLKAFGLACRGWRANFQFDPPFRGFREKVLELLSRTVVTHQKLQKLSGTLHEETNYSPGFINESGELVSAKRVEVNALTFAQIKKVRDKAIKGILVSALEKRGWDSTEAHYSRLVKEGAFKSLTMPSGIPVKKVRIEEIIGRNSSRLVKDKTTGREYRRLQTGANYALVLTRGSSKVEKISLWDAVERLKQRGERLTGDLIIRQGDYFEIENRIYRVKKLSITGSGGPDIGYQEHILADNSSIKANDETGRYLRYTSAKKILENTLPITPSCLGQRRPS